MRVISISTALELGLMLCSVLHCENARAATAASTVNAEVFNKTEKSFNLSTRVWFGGESLALDDEFVELRDDSIKCKSSTAIVFSGGGARSFSLSIGYLAGLHQLGLTNTTQYIGGISGGNWAVASFVYYQRGKPNVANSDDEFLCPYFAPANLTTDAIKSVSNVCALQSVTAHDLYTTVLENYAESILPGSGLSVRDVWAKSISEMFLEPFGIPAAALFSLNESTIADIKSRNPSLINSSFVAINENRPYPIFGATLTGPAGSHSLTSSNRSFTMVEGTPLYVGAPNSMNITYTLGSKHETVEVGGYIEPFAMGSTPPQHATTITGDSDDVVTHKLYALQDIVGASSFFAGGELSTWPFFNDLVPTETYWARGAATLTQTTMLYADGGCVENVNLISMVRRRVKSIIVFANFQATLANASHWNPTTTPDDNNSKNIDSDVTAYFGIGSGMSKTAFGIDIHRDQIFNQSDFVPLALALQKAQATGNGAIATVNLTTIENKWWGVAAGITTSITWVYLSRQSEWEHHLPDDIRREIVPTKDPLNPQSLPTSGPFKNFPSFDDLTQQHLSPPQANMLKNMAQWTVHQNADVFRRVLGAASA